VCFSGDNLGWTPKTITSFSQPFTAPGEPTYNMVPNKGAIVHPATAFGLGTGSTGVTDTLSGLPATTAGQTLAYAFAGHGLGIAALDADLDLWIPVQKPAGTYNAVLTFTAI
jgi:hypothetical protein